MVVDKQETFVPASSDPAEAEQQIVAVKNQQETFAAVAPNIEEEAIVAVKIQQEMLVTLKQNKGKKVIKKIGKTLVFEKKENPIISKHRRSNKKKMLSKKTPVACYDDNTDIPVVLDCRTGNAYETDVGIFDGAIPLEIISDSVREGKKREQVEEEGQETPYVGDVDEYDDELIEEPGDETEDKVRTQPSKYQKLKHYTKHS